MTRTRFKSFKQKVLKQPGVAEAYDELVPAYTVRRQLVALRQSAGLTQEQMAQKLNTNKSNISRLESVYSDISPKLSTIVDYADVMGYDVRLDFVPRKKAEHIKRTPRTLEKRSRTRGID
jgi:transcriptional regulator with XRE-family HTH domain